MRQRGIKSADGIKIVNQLTSKQRHSLGLSGWTQGDPKSPYRKNPPGGRGATVRMMSRETQLATAGFAGGGRGSQPRKVGSPSNLEK